jgi:hypothetical protein
MKIAVAPTPQCPTPTPTANPTKIPTANPTVTPTANPTASPTTRVIHDSHNDDRDRFQNYKKTIKKKNRHHFLGLI